MPSKLERLEIYLKKEEKNLAKTRAKSYGLSVSSFGRQAILKNELPMTLEEREFLFKLIFEIKRAGMNLNQISKALNYSRIFDSQQPTNFKVDAAVNEFREAIKLLTEQF
jgi:hypothetical protein